MATFTRVPFSGSTGGRGIKISATSSTGTTVHTTGTSASVYDEIWLYLYNGHTATVVATVQFGGTSSPDDDIVLTLPFKSGLTLVVPGLVLAGDGSSGKTVAVYAATANVVVATGYVNRIS